MKKKTENEKGAHQETRPDSWLKTILAPLFNFLEQLFVIHRISSSRQFLQVQKLVPLALTGLEKSAKFKFDFFFFGISNDYSSFDRPTKVE
jgi:hypothetical protein